MRAVALADDTVQKKVAKSFQKLSWVPPNSWPTVGGKAMIEAAKMTGMTPAMLTRSGR